MLRVATKFVMKMKEEKQPTLYKIYIDLVINHVGAVDTSVLDTTVNDVWQMIRDKKCTYITGEDDKELEGEDIIGAQDVEKMFKPEEMTADVKDQIAKCFEEMSEAHEAIKKVYKSAVKLVLKLSSKGMGVFLEAWHWELQTFWTQGWQIFTRYNTEQKVVRRSEDNREHQLI